MFPSELSGPVSPLNLPHEFVIAPYNSISATGPFITDSIAAILVEPVQGAGGAIPATREFLQFLRAEATRVGALLIIDEVMTSRLAWGGMQEVHDIKPDLMTMGKYLGGGMNFGSFGGREEIMKAFDPRTGVLVHAGTFNNNVLGMAAGVAGAKVLTKAKLENMNALGDELRTKFEELLKEMKVDNISITGYGSMIGVHVGDGERREILKECFFMWCLEQGLYIGKRGFFALNIEHTKKDLEKALQVVKQFVEEFREYF
jgi:glutamate-1-semialdehyde 2,1-aminomutase